MNCALTTGCYRRCLAGHSHWHNTRHRKAGQDKNRSDLFRRLSLSLTAAARAQLRADGCERFYPDAGATVSAELSRAIRNARKHGLPKSRIDNAIAVARREASDRQHVATDTLHDAKQFEFVLTRDIGCIARFRDLRGSSRTNGWAREIRKIIATAGGKAANVRDYFERHWVVKVHFDCNLSVEDVKHAADRAALAGIDAGAMDVDVDLASKQATLMVAEREVACKVQAAITKLQPQPQPQPYAVHLQYVCHARRGSLAVSEDIAHKLASLQETFSQRTDFVELVHNAALPARNNE